MVSHSSEFENIVVRDEEQNELEMMVQTLCPLEVKGGPSNKHGKISILIQACLLGSIGVDGFTDFKVEQTMTLDNLYIYSLIFSCTYHVGG